MKVPGAKPSSVSNSAGPADVGGGRNRTRLMLAAGTLVAIVLAGAVLVLTRPESAEEDFDPIGGAFPQTSASADSTSVAASPSASPRRTLAAVQRNPFRPLVTDSATVAAPATGDGTAVATAVPTSTATVPPASNPAPTSTPTGLLTGTPAVGLLSLEVIDVAADDRSAQVTVNDQAYTATSFVPILDAILPLSFEGGKCGWFLTAVENRVRICEGETQDFLLQK